MAVETMIKLKLTIPLALAFVLTACGGQDNPHEYGKQNSYSESQDPLKSIDIGCICTTRDLLPSVASSIRVDIAWSQIEPEPRSYDWSHIDEAIEDVKRSGHTVALTIMNGPYAPAWLKDSGVGFVTLADGREIPAAWDSEFLSHYGEFIQELGARYNAEDAITLIHTTNSSPDGITNWFPTDENQASAFLNAGYTDQEMVNSWIAILTFYSNSFPAKKIDFDLQPIMGNSSLPVQIASTGFEIAEERFGVLASWWSYEDATERYAPLTEIIEEFASRSFANVKFVAARNPNTNEDALTGLDIYNSIGLAAQIGIKHMEIYQEDLLDSDTVQIIREALRGEQYHKSLIY